MARCPGELEQLLEREIDSLGYELVLAEIAKAGGDPLLRVYIDGPRSITLNDCEAVSARLSALLDVEDLSGLSGRYTLEVSSPGVERPLARKRDFRRFAGSLVRIQTRSHHLGRRNFTGTLLAAADADEDPDSVAVEVDDEVYTLPFSDIQSARLKADWPPPEERARPPALGASNEEAP